MGSVLFIRYTLYEYAYFKSTGTLSLVFPTCRMNSEKYQSFLREKLFSFIYKFRQQNFNLEPNFRYKASSNVKAYSKK